MKGVLDSDDGVECDNECQRWFHRQCLQMSKIEYQRISSNNNEKWFCARADCLKTENQPQTTLLKQLSLLTDKISELTINVNALSALPSKIDNMATKDEVNSLSSGIDKLRESIDSRLTHIESRVDDLDNRIQSLEDQVAPSTSSFEVFFGEIEDRNRRAYNLMVYNLPESRNKEVDSRIRFDKENVMELAQAIGYEINLESLKLYRIGKPVASKSRPLKLVFRSTSDAASFLSEFVKAKLMEGNSKFSNVGVSRDRTNKERQYLSSLRAELDSRIKKGEENLTIKYKNGIPSIVPKN